MSSIAIYMEGGGDGKDSKAALRLGMDAFLNPLKDAVRAKEWKWRLVCCGGRNAAFDGFRNAVQNGDDTIVALLVDAEEAVNAPARAHLQSRDRWDLESSSDNVVHLMVQAMEAWVIADPDALAAYYGQKFRKTALPKARNLETVAKDDVAKALEEATRDTQKGPYHKVRHASDLLKRIDRDKVQKRCPHCARLFDTLLKLIQKA
jgi:hypothetical protein